MTCRRISLSIRAMLGNLKGVLLPGLLRGKKDISVFLSRAQRPLSF
jgi:hypothetical protein